MSDTLSYHPRKERFEKIKQLRQEFEKQWVRPKIENCLEQVDDEALRRRLLEELLVTEWECRLENGEIPTKQEYLTRFPDEREMVTSLFSDEGNSLETLSPNHQFSILESHDQGGLGEIFVARDKVLGREVALKQIRYRKGEKKSEDRVARFMLEGEITARLEHPGIVPVYAMVKDHAENPQYVMRFVRGDDMDEAIKKFHRAEGTQDKLKPWNMEFRELLRRFIAVCEAVGYAHSRGVLHRDLKPANVMLGKHGETYVIDWGMAKLLDQPADGDETPLQPVTASYNGTSLGIVKGTFAYAAPEQLAGRKLTPAADVFGLGGILYRLLTNELPRHYQEMGGGSDPSSRRKQREVIPPPRTVHPEVPAALNAICMTAMAENADDRYASATALAEDVELWLAGEPVSAWREPITARSSRWMKRRKALVSTVFTSLILLIVAGAIAIKWRSDQRAEAMERLKLNLSSLEHDYDREKRQAQLGNISEVRVADQKRILERAVTARGTAEEWGDAALSGVAKKYVAELTTMIAGCELLIGIDQAKAQELHKAFNPLFKPENALRLYRLAFRKHGVVETIGSDEAVGKLAALPNDLRDPVVAGLSRWLLSAEKNKSPDDILWLRAVLDGVRKKQSPMFARIHEVEWSGNARRLEALLEDAKSSKLSAGEYLALSGMLTRLEQKSSLEILDKAQQIYSGNFWVNFELAFNLTMAKQYGAAARYYGIAENIRPNSQAVQVNLGTVYLQEGQIDRAIILYQRANTSPTLRFGPSEYHAVSLSLQGHLKAAIALLQHLLLKQPDSPSIHLNLAATYLDTGDEAEAIAHYRAAVDKSPGTNEWREWLKEARLLIETYDLYVAKNYSKAFERSLSADKDEEFKNSRSASFRFNGARYAALALQNTDLADEKRKTFRVQAANWLRTELKLWKNRWNASDKSDWRAFQIRFKQWREHEDLAFFRDESELAKLPDEERTSWEILWLDVRAILEQTDKSIN